MRTFPVGPWTATPGLLRLEGGGRIQRVSPNEMALLDYLHQHRDRGPIPRAELLIEVFGYAPGVASRTVDSTLSRLRQKLERPGAPLVEAIRGRGIRLRQQVEGATVPPPREAPAWKGLDEVWTQWMIWGPSVLTSHRAQLLSRLDAATGPELRQLTLTVLHLGPAARLAATRRAQARLEETEDPHAVQAAAYLDWLEAGPSGAAPWLARLAGHEPDDLIGQVLAATVTPGRPLPDSPALWGADPIARTLSVERFAYALDVEAAIVLLRKVHVEAEELGWHWRADDLTASMGIRLSRSRAYDEAWEYFRRVPHDNAPFERVGFAAVTAWGAGVVDAGHAVISQHIEATASVDAEQTETLRAIAAGLRALSGQASAANDEATGILDRSAANEETRRLCRLVLHHTGARDDDASRLWVNRLQSGFQPSDAHPFAPLIRWLVAARPTPTRPSR